MAWQGCCPSQPCPNCSHTIAHTQSQRKRGKKNRRPPCLNSSRERAVAVAWWCCRQTGVEKLLGIYQPGTHRRTVDSLTMQLCLSSRTSPARSSRTQQTQTHTCPHTTPQCDNGAIPRRRNTLNQLSLPLLHAAFDVSSSPLVSAPPGNSASNMHPAGNKACCALIRGWAGLRRPGNTPNHNQTQHGYCCAPVQLCPASLLRVHQLTSLLILTTNSHISTV